MMTLSVSTSILLVFRWIWLGYGCNEFKAYRTRNIKIIHLLFYVSVELRQRSSHLSVVVFESVISICDTVSINMIRE